MKKMNHPAAELTGYHKELFYYENPGFQTFLARFL